MLISTDKIQKFGYYRKTYTSLGVLSGYYYFFRLKSGSRLRLKAPDNKKWSTVDATFLDSNAFNYEISNDQKLLIIKVKNIPKNSLHLYDFMVKLDGIDTFISFVINRNYEYLYENVYYNNKKVLTNYNFYLGYSEYLWYSIEYQNVFHSFNSNESNTKFVLNLSSLISNIETNWYNNSNIYKKPQQSKVQNILNKLNSYKVLPEMNLSWEINTQQIETTLPEMNLSWEIIHQTNKPGAQLIWTNISPMTLFAQWNLEEQSSNDNLTLQATWTVQ